MHFKVDDVRIREIKELATPAHLLREFPCSEKTEELTYNTRQAIHRVLHGSDDRVLVIIGPCSIDRKSTRLNSSHTVISYAVFCLKKKNKSDSFAILSFVRPC